MQAKNDRNKRLICDIVFIAVIIAVGLSALFILQATGVSGKEVLVTVNGEEVGCYPLAVDGTFEINGGSNILVIQGGAAYIDYADCPDGTCKLVGKISLEGERIICLPNRVIVEIR